jgi:Tripartite tricarboxylate transporter TctB family
MAIKSQQNLAAGLMFTILGAGFAIGAREYDMGTSGRMGAGYFPFLLGSILAVLGVLITIQSFGSQRRSSEDIGRFAWRPLSFVIGANLLFGLLLGGLPSLGIPAMGLMVAIVGLTFVSMLASDFCIKRAVMLSAILAIGSYLVFVKMLGLTFQVWPWFVGA